MHFLVTLRKQIAGSLVHISTTLCKRLCNHVCAQGSWWISASAQEQIWC